MVNCYDNEYIFVYDPLTTTSNKETFTKVQPSISEYLEKFEEVFFSLTYIIIMYVWGG